MKRPATRQNRSLLAALLFSVVIGTAACAQTFPALTLRQELEHLWAEFEVPVKTGHYHLLSSPTAEEIAGGKILFTAEAAQTSTGRVDLAALPADATRFVALLHYPLVSLEELVEPILDAPKEVEPDVYFDSPNLPRLLPGNLPFPLTIKLRDGGRNPLGLDGRIVFSLVDFAGNPVGFEYRLNRPEINVRGGEAQAYLSIDAAIDPGEARLAAKYLSNIAPPLEPPVTEPTRTRIVSAWEPRPWVEYRAESPAHWRHPLPAAAPIIATFGQWPSHDEIHRGVDFAAPAGTPVLAPARGVVIDADPGDQSGNGWVVLDHGNGVITAFAHVQPTVTLEAVLEAGAPVGEIAAGSRPHLHFELMRTSVEPGPEYQYRRGRRPAELVDPVTAAAALGFEPSLLPPDPDPPVLASLTLNAQNPALHSYTENPWRVGNGQEAGASNVFVCILAFADSESESSRPGLSRLRFLPEGGDPQVIDFTGSETDVNEQHLNPSRPGHARVPTSELGRPGSQNRYWFPWNLARYREAPTGPRGFALELTGIAGNQLVVTQRYGPEIVAVQPVAESPAGVSHYELHVRAALGGPETGSLRTQPDRYRLSLVCGARWVENGAAELVSEPFTSPGEERIFLFELPADVPRVQAIRVASMLLPDLATEYRLVIPGTNAEPGLVWIPPGSFVMGSPETELHRDADESPLTTVTLSRGFWMGKFEVTQREYLAVMGVNPSRFTCVNGYTDDLDRPVEMVSWYDSTNYCARLTDRERSAGRLPEGTVYRLPTEAEWEYACRAGTTTAFHFGTALTASLANFNWRYEYDSEVGIQMRPDQTPPNQPLPVGHFAPNAFGLFDMHGNIWEWCLDWHGGLLPGGEVTDPVGHSSQPYRVLRGGGWEIFAWHCRSANRSIALPGVQTPIRGLRVVRTIPIP